MNKNIFLVEDDSAIVDVYTMLLKKSGFSVEVFNLGQEAIRAVKSASADDVKKPAVVLLDLTLPDMDGGDVLKEIKNNDFTRGIKVFILTNQSDVAFEGVQPDKIIIKANTTPSQLVDILKEALSLS